MSREQREVLTHRGLIAVSFEDKRKQNYLQGQAELERRQRELAAELQREEDERQEKNRQEQERQEKLRVEKEKERQAEQTRFLERQRQMEVQMAEKRRQAHEARVAESRERDKQRAMEAEQSRVQMLRNQLRQMEQAIQQAASHQESLKESAQEQNKRQEDVINRRREAEATFMLAKQTIDSMKPRKDQLENDIRTRLEQIEAAKVEFNRLQREREQLSLQAVSNVSAQQVEEAGKTLTDNIQSRKARIADLQQRIKSGEEHLAKNGEALATNRNQFAAQEDQFKNLIQYTEQLRRSLLDKSLATTGSFQDPLLVPLTNA
ncbi:hypothetical protein Ciccas_010422 [Cichlidogyrus casuarinus]|uniref:Uncharacterized protein n=1 Tax=Cichlidogyrus casuarinus TaxID=1844966 RepID=A0ABD2PUZ4_9PLAT